MKVKYGKVGITVLKHTIHRLHLPKKMSRRSLTQIVKSYKPGKNLNSKRPKSLAKI